MSGYVPIDRQRHTGKSWRPIDSFSFAARMCMVPLVRSELGRAVSAMPVAFVKQADDYELMAVLALHPDDNFYVAAGGRWLGSYIPAFLRSYPFRVVSPPDRPQEKILCFDEDHGVADGLVPGWNSFFDEQGDLSSEVRKVVDFLATLERDRSITRVALNALEQAGLIVPWKIKLQSGQSEQQIDGLHRIDEEALNGVDDQNFLALRHAGAIPLVYSQLLSMNQLERFPGLQRMREQIQRSPPTKPVYQGTAGFELRADETLKFD